MDDLGAGAARSLERAEWKDLCDRLSRLLTGKQVEIEVGSLAIGEQIEADWLPLLGMAYDPKDDLIEIALPGLDHMVQRPRQLLIQEGDGGVSSILLIDEAGTRQILRFRDPLLLPPA